MRENPEYIARQDWLTLRTAIVSACLMPLLVGCEPGVEDSDDGPICGDGVQAPDEACDDGNLIAGDGCSPECIVSGTRFECATIVEGDWLNQANVLLPLADQTFVVAGESMRETEARGWIGRFDRAGEQLWFRQVVPTNPGDGDIVDLAADRQGGNWALTHNGETSELLHFDSSGATDRSIDIPSAFELPVYAYAIESDEDRLWIGGASQGDLWLGRYDLQGDQAQTILLEDYRGFDDRIHALSRSGAQLGVAATVSTSSSTVGNLDAVAPTDILFIRFDLQGHELARTEWVSDPGSEYARLAEQLVADGEGQWFVGGSLLPINTTNQVQSWVGRVEPAPAWMWSTHDMFGDKDTVEFGGLTLVDDAVVMGAGASAGGGEEAWLLRFSEDGELGWREVTAAAPFKHHASQQLAVDVEGQLRVVAKTWTPGETSVIESCLIAW